jgi:hypothetical protein
MEGYERVEILERLSNAVYHLGTFTAAAPLQTFCDSEIGHKVFVAFRSIADIRDREYNGFFFLRSYCFTKSPGVRR